MASQNKKSKAEKAVSASQKGRGNSKKTTSKSTKQPEAQKGFQIPPRVISGTIFLALFILLLVVYLKPDGQIPKMLNSFLCGLIGRVGFIIAIPGSLCLFMIHAFSNKRPVILRSIFVGIFVLTCGCLFHLSSNYPLTESGFAVARQLYDGGIAGKAGGLLCGGACELLSALLGNILSYICLIVLAIFALLGAMQITIPSIIRAIQSRPRLDEKEKEDKPDPASLVVNHIAQKHIQKTQARRERQAALAEEEKALEAELAKKQAEEKEIPIPEPTYTIPGSQSKVDDIIRQIDVDLDVPVAAAATAPAVSTDVNVEIPVIGGKLEDAFPENMPELLVEDGEEPAKPVKKPDKVTAQEARESAEEIANEIAQAMEEPKQVYAFPPIDLLRLPNRNGMDATGEMRDNTLRLQDTLESFKIEANIVNVTRGPSVTRYEVELEKGVRLNKLTNSADDIALSLGASGVRIAAVPGKISVVGIEVPNKAVTSVTLREVIDSVEFDKAKSSSSFAVGKDIGGNCIIGNVAKLPHMLIAGTTGSGKSVCMNSIIISLLYKASPDDVKLIMIDPKMVELGVYNDIPHLLIPVVTDPKKAAGSLQWAVVEMMRRYKAMSDANVRDLDSYNSMVESQQIDGDKLPQVVVIIDELADLMLVAAKEVEESICRIAQMGRAAGIHLIIATQRPSADVITGLMKANIPSRIAFAVASAMESRIILDTQGAEKLVGRGDMLYAPIGSGKPLRVQGCFVSEQEVEAVANHVKTAYTSAYNQQIMDDIERKAAQTGNKTVTASDPEPNADESSYDELLPAAVDVILETNQASASMLQRRLKLGYSRASRIIDQMAELGLVGPYNGSKPREVVITKEKWETMRNNTGGQMNFEDLQETESFDDEF